MLADGGGDVAREPFSEAFCEVFAAGDGEVIETGFVYDQYFLISARGVHITHTLFVIIQPGQSLK